MHDDAGVARVPRNISSFGRSFPALPSVLLFFIALSVLMAQTSFPRVEMSPPKALRQHLEALAQALRARNDSALPAAALRQLTVILAEEHPERLTAQVQALLDPYCLAAVHINPQSRVKVSRGPWPAALIAKKSVTVLVKIHNEGGVTQGPAVRDLWHERERHWLELDLRAPTGKHRLTGQPLEYHLLRLTAHATGKREAVLVFDVGQGTQDLGFRAELPVLFTIVERSE
ncbi:MAG: hypothetical protein C4297_01955 [Gemmataceae bacterium]